jgi:hypothetical protein
MLKSLERIERKLEKGSDSSKIESRKTPERKRDQEVSGPLRKEEDRGVVADIIVAP